MSVELDERLVNVGHFTIGHRVWNNPHSVRLRTLATEGRDIHWTSNFGPMSTVDSKARAVLVTGASSGVGRSVALLLAERGFRVFATVRSDAAAADLKQTAGPQLHPLIMDVTSADQIAAAVEQVERLTGDDGLAGLVNNAGIFVAGPLEFLVGRPLARPIRGQRIWTFGRDTVISSIVAQRARPSGERWLDERATQRSNCRRLRGIPNSRWKR